MTTVLFSVGDASGDVYAADLSRELARRLHEPRFLGLGGVEMEKAGVELVVHQRDLSVGGLFELLPDLPRVVRAWRRMVRVLAESRPDLVILVDSSGFNIPFAGRARSQRIPTLYYVSPQVWAWRRGRIRKIARRVDRMAAIFPFEPEVYASTDLPVEFVGHPLVERLRDAAERLEGKRARAALGLDPEARIVALLPGSRRAELRYVLGIQLETARILHARDPAIHFVLPVAPAIDRADVEARIRSAGLPSGLRLDVVSGRSLEAVCACDVALVKPGTSTLEATLLGRPLVVAARGNPLTAFLLRRLVKVDSLTMPNLIAGEPIVPEFFQRDAVPERIADAVQERLAGPVRDDQLARLGAVREQLRTGGAARRAAEIAEEMLVARLRG